MKAEEEARRAEQLACLADTRAAQTAAAKGVRWAPRTGVLLARRIGREERAQLF